MNPDNNIVGHTGTIITDEIGTFNQDYTFDEIDLTPIRFIQRNQNRGNTNIRVRINNDRIPISEGLEEEDLP